MRKKREVRIINGVEKLRCSVCKYWLPFDEYSNDKKTSTGKRAYCKCCQKKYSARRRKRPYNSGLIGLYLETCSQCKEQFTTKSSARTFCSQKCARRWHYEKNEQTETGKLYGRSKVIFNIKKMNKGEWRMKALEMLKENKEVMKKFVDSFDIDCKDDDEYISANKHIEQLNEAITELKALENRKCEDCAFNKGRGWCRAMDIDTAFIDRGCNLWESKQ